MATGFVLGKDEMPDWFKEACRKGSAKINHDIDGEIKEAVLINPTSRIICKPGDTIQRMRTGMCCIKASNKFHNPNIEKR